MANRYSRSDREQNRNRDEDQQNFGGSRREQNFNEYNRGQGFSGGQSMQSSGAGRGYNHGGRGNFGRQSTGREFNRDFTKGGNYGQNYSSEFNRDVGTHFGGGSRGNFGKRQWGGGREFGRGDDRQGRYDVGRDFMTNQPIREGYGQMDDDTREFGGQNWGERDFGRRSSGDYGSEFRYAEPNRDFAERGGYSGSTYGSYRNRGFRDDYDTGRTDFDESIAGRRYYGTGSDRGYEREGWRGYGSRPGNMGFGDRERPDDWNRTAYGEGSFGRSGRGMFGRKDYGSTQYGGNYREDPWLNRERDWDRGDYIGAEYYRDYDRESRGESFGDKVKNFFGIGPKGYTRSDDRIREDISERLEDHPAIDASNIEIRVENGEVTLTGMVDNRRAKRLAEDIAEECRGVKDVHNQIRVQQTVFGETGKTGSAFDLTSGSASHPSTGTTGTTTTTTKKSTEKAA